jgi:alpha-galactosidase
MLVVGNPGVSLDESRAQLSLWAIMAAPLIAGNDLPNMSPEVMQLLANREVIAVAQDQAGTPGNIADDTGTGLQVWARPLADGSRAVALLNRTDSPAPITAIWEKVGLPPGSAAARDLWAHADLGTFAGSMTATVPAHGVVMLRVASASPAGWLSERAPSALSNGYGPAELDQSNGEAGQGDGRRISVGGRQFLRGVGAHAPFESTYDLGGGCQRLTADIGVDDEVGVGSGSVVFQVWADGALRYESPVMRGGEPAARVDVDLSEVQQLRLVVGDAGDGTNYDHADWAGAQLRCGG